jgi:16S rRNA (cytosine967-C5)-methyltransferase
LRQLLGGLLDRGFPADSPRVETALLLGAAQILWLEVPDHAAVDLSVRLVQADRRGGHYAGLTNAVLRRLTQDGKQRLAALDAAKLDTPDWLMQRWTRAYGAETARAIAQADSHEPALDLTVKEGNDSWATRLRGRVLPTGSVRLIPHGAVSLLPGYPEGAWWVQDAAAALPARLLGEVSGRKVADLCAAPGGKTAQLAHAGAHVVAVDRSEPRIARLRENIARVGYEVETVVADATEWEAGPFDAVLLDAPCTSTGTIRRHPDIPWLKQESDIAGLTALQRRLLDRAAVLTKPGGTLVYSTCSLEPEEGELQIEALLEREPRLRRRPIVPAEVAGLAEFITPRGDLRTLPCHLPDPDPRLAGIDGFYAARLEMA